SRYATAQEMADDLKRFLEDKPILARRPTLLERVRKWTRRHRSLVQASVVLMILAILALGTSTVLVWHEHAQTKRERQEAIAARERADAALGQLEEKAKAAEEQNKLALETINTLVYRVQELLDDKPGTQKLKQELLGTALEGLERVARSVDNSVA